MIHYYRTGFIDPLIVKPGIPILVFMLLVISEAFDTAGYFFLFELSVILGLITFYKEAVWILLIKPELDGSSGSRWTHPSPVR